jgi:hypothetical protein
MMMQNNIWCGKRALSKFNKPTDPGKLDPRFPLLLDLRERSSNLACYQALLLQTGCILQVPAHVHQQHVGQVPDAKRVI